MAARLNPLSDHVDRHAFMKPKFFTLLGAAALLGAVIGVLLQTPAKAAAVDIELVLAVDASGSIDTVEYVLQKGGYAEAFKNPRVVKAIQSGVRGAIAVTYVEWTGPGLQAPIVDWTLISDAESANKFAGALLAAERQLFSGGTAVGEAVLHASTLFEDNGFEGARRVIDISGDGPTNKGRAASWARDQVARQDITINGLAIVDEYPELHLFFLDHVIGGPGAFAIPARGFNDFSAAILSKLIREIAGVANPANLAITEAGEAETTKTPRHED